MRSTILCLFFLNSFTSAQEYVTIRGQVKWNGSEPPKREAIQSKEFKPTEIVLKNDILVDEKSLGFKNVLVWLRPDTEDRKDTFPKEQIKPELQKPKPKHHVLDVVGWQFEPRAIAARAGDTFEFDSSSKHAHNLNYNSENESISPLLPTGPNFKLKRPLGAQLTPISFTCNIHPWMAGRMRVFDHPYFAVTDADGKFEIRDAPVGKWRVVYWHEHGFHKGREGILGFPIELKVDKPGGTTMELKPIPFEIVKPKP